MTTQALKPETSLQGGRYKIIKTLGQGGFGITYLALQSGLERQVAVKEFFMKELCERDANNSHVTLGTARMREQVVRFREKFLKEARNIAKLNHPNIVRIIDVFEENGTAYYVMEYAEGGSVADKLKAQETLPELVAIRYVKQVANALSYIHQRNMSHLDVKPGNIMLTENDDVVLIDFGLAKQYDSATGNQTSTTPVGISDGYAPMEQYKQGGVGAFSPETDIYALGATLYKMLTGVKPPSASDVMEDGVPLDELKKVGSSAHIIDLIVHAMKPRKKDRIHTAEEFLQGMEKKEIAQQDDSTTVVIATVDNAAEEAQKESVKTFTVNGVSFDMIRVEAGTFTMGATPEMKDPFDDETPHQVTLTNDYYLGKTVVTQKLWKVVMGKREVKPSLLGKMFGAKTRFEDINPSFFIGDNLPVECVSWHDCQTFISKLNALSRMRFRMPTEAEWEFAARGGKKSLHYEYSGSNNLDEVAWYSGGSSHDVAVKKANELGFYDMSGNVWEWCSDWYKKNYGSSKQTDPSGPASGSYRVIRGGGWSIVAWRCRSSYRDYGSPDFSDYDLGLRLALSE